MRGNAPEADRAARANAILACVAGDEDTDLSAVLDPVIDDAWHRSVLGRAPPAFAGLACVPKIRAGFATYCALGLSAIACSRRRPAAFRVASSGARVFGLGEARVASLSKRALPWVYRVFLGRELDLVACASAFILLIDEIFDDQLAHEDGDARVKAVDDVVHGRRMARLAQANADAVDAAFALVEALRTSSPARWPAMAQRLVAWADAEVRLERGDESVEPRKAGIEVSMELLAFAAPKFVGDVELSWMQEIARLGQMIDDVLDVEKDLAAGRVTLGATGAWNVETVAVQYRKLIEDTRALVAQSERNEAVRALFERTFRARIRHLAQVLVDNP